VKITIAKLELVFIMNLKSHGVMGKEVPINNRPLTLTLN
jgi:hypothetical protein